MSTEHEKQDQRHLQREADRAKPRSKLSVMGYITVLFAAAFLLLLMSYFMQQRRNEEVISGLKESVSAMQSLQNLQSDKDTLQDRVTALEEELAQTKQSLESMTAEQAGNRDAIELLSLQVSALDWLREIQALYAKQYYKAARAMIAEFESAGLPEYLPDTSLHTYDGSDVLSPAEQYTRIADALN